jgi:hypothetical protein
MDYTETEQDGILRRYKFTLDETNEKAYCALSPRAEELFIDF